MSEQQPLTPILEWLCEEQAGISGKDLAETAGIAPQTWSKVRQGKQDLSSELIWRILHAIAFLRPESDAAKIVAIIEGKNVLHDSLTDLIEKSSDAELEAAMLLIIRKIFSKEREDALVS